MSILVTIDECWADEFDCEKFWIFESEAEWLKAYGLLIEEFLVGGVREWGFGSNESLDFANYDDFVRQFNVNTIPLEQYEIIKSIFGNEFGTGPGYF